MAGRAQRGKRRRERERAEQQRQRRLQNIVLAVVGVLAVVLLAVGAYPMSRYAQAESVYAELTDCDTPTGSRVDCTAVWKAEDGRRCEARVRADKFKQRRSGRDYVRADGCDLRDDDGTLFLAGVAFAVVSLAMAGTFAWQRRRASTER